jgi:hypothetical protein
MAGIADDLCIIRSMQTEQINHDPAHAFMNSGSIIKGRPSMGSWLLYGLGSETQDLPGFIVLTSAGKTGQQPVSARQWSAGILPSKFQGILFQSKGDAVHYVGSPEGVCQSTQRQVVEEVNRLNGLLAEERHDPEIQTRISQYEMAFRMQSSVPELTAVANESAATYALYGDEAKKPGTFAHSALLARRMVERGVRFVQIYHNNWDHHGNLAGRMPDQCKDVDQPCYGLIQDLKQRGLLDETLVIWGGEFGRTVYSQGGLSKENYGRDHHPRCFTMWMACGGARPGQVYGETDDFSYNIVKDPVHIRDFHASVLNLLGFDHQRFTYRYQGLDQKLTGVEQAHVIKALLA